MSYVTLFFKGRLARFLNLLVASAIFLATIPVQSQDKKEPRKSAEDEDVIRVTSNLWQDGY